MTAQTSSASDPFNKALADWREGRFAVALAGLRRATKGGDAGCASLLLQLSAEPVAPSNARAAAARAVLAAPAAPQQCRHAAFLRASGYGMDADPASALTQRLAQARAGDALAMTEIALLSALGDNAVTRGEDGPDPVRTQLETAAAAGSAAATAALMRLGLERGALSPVARRQADALGRSGHPLAASLIPAAIALPDAAASRAQATDDSWPAAEDLVATILNLPPQSRSETLNQTPRMARWTGFLPAILCDYLITAATPLLNPARIFDPETGQARPDPYRQSLTAALPDGAMDLVLWAIKLRMAGLAGARYDQGEPLAVLIYRPGEQYRPHVDYLSEDGGSASANLARRGQRLATSLVRLNHEFTGGDTVFPRLDQRWTGQRGDALQFDNTDADGRGDPMTLHAGEPVNSGMKILASLWLRERA